MAFQSTDPKRLKLRRAAEVLEMSTRLLSRVDPRTGEVANSVYHVESALRAYYTAPAAFQFFEILVPLRERSRATRSG